MFPKHDKKNDKGFPLLSIGNRVISNKHAKKPLIDRGPCQKVKLENDFPAPVPSSREGSLKNVFYFIW